MRELFVILAFVCHIFFPTSSAATVPSTEAPSLPVQTQTLDDNHDAKFSGSTLYGGFLEHFLNNNFYIGDGDNGKIKLTIQSQSEDPFNVYDDSTSSDPNVFGVSNMIGVGGPDFWKHKSSSDGKSSSASSDESPEHSGDSTSESVDDTETADSDESNSDSMTSASSDSTTEETSTEEKTTQTTSSTDDSTASNTVSKSSSTEDQSESSVTSQSVSSSDTRTDTVKTDTSTTTNTDGTSSSEETSSNSKTEDEVSSRVTTCTSSSSSTTEYVNCDEAQSASLGDECCGTCADYNAECRSMGRRNICVCKAGYQHETVVNACGYCKQNDGKLGATCGEDTACTEPFSVCLDGRCTCDDDHFSVSGKCVGNMFDDNCSEEHDTCAEEYTRCNRGTCVCKVGFIREGDACVGEEKESRYHCHVCNVTDDCSEGLVCDTSQNMCVCPQGKVLINGACYGTGYGEDCTLPTDTCSEDLTTCISGKCRCVHDYSYDSAAQKCVGPEIGNPCLRDTDCKTAHTKCSSPTSLYGTGVCECQTGLFRHNSGQCVGNHMNDTCVEEADSCFENHVICDNGICTCAGLFTPGMDGCVGNSICYPCDNDDHCQDPNSRCVDKKCVCEDGLVRIGGVCYGSGEHMDTCHPYVDTCTGPFQSCLGGFCDCIPPTIYNSTYGLCLGSKLEHPCIDDSHCFGVVNQDGEPVGVCHDEHYMCVCAHGLDQIGQVCSDGLYGSPCMEDPLSCRDRYSVCVDGHCRCMFGVGPDDACYAPLGGSCEYSPCGPYALCTEAYEDGTYCDQVCVCQDGFIPAFGPFACGGSCVPQRKYNETCSSFLPHHCDPEDNIVCQTGHCVCQEGAVYMAAINACLFDDSDFGEPCDCQTHCSPGTSCMNVNNEFMCSCISPFFVQDSTNSTCLKALPVGDPCNEGDVCIENAICDTASHVCACKPSYKKAWVPGQGFKCFLIGF